MTASGDDRSGPSITTRTALILTISLLAGLGAGLLLHGSGDRPAQTVTGGIGAFIGAIELLHRWIVPDQPHRRR